MESLCLQRATCQSGWHSGFQLKRALQEVTARSRRLQGNAAVGIYICIRRLAGGGPCAYSPLTLWWFPSARFQLVPGTMQLLQPFVEARSLDAFPLKALLFQLDPQGCRF